jgi:hypothetical protein
MAPRLLSSTYGAWRRRHNACYTLAARYLAAASRTHASGGCDHVGVAVPRSYHRQMACYVLQLFGAMLVSVSQTFVCA